MLFVRERIKGVSHAVCEDYADVRGTSEYVLFAVADGHGDPACVRSAQGSKFAVEAVLGILKKLASSIMHPSAKQEGYKDDLLERKESSQVLDWVAEAIVREWKRAIAEDLEAHPLEQEELEAMGERGRKWAQSDDVHLYGSTLLAGLFCPDLVVLLAQGDGSSVCVSTEGDVLCPLPEDSRCVGNVTTSLCDADAARAMRFAVIDRRTVDVLACFVATDGVDKSLAGEDAVKALFGNVVLDLAERGDADGTINSLRETLEELRDKGAGDDTSVAGFIDVDAARHCVDALRASHDKLERNLELNLQTEVVLTSLREGKTPDVVPDAPDEVQVTGAQRAAAQESVPNYRPTSSAYEGRAAKRRKPWPIIVACVLVVAALGVAALVVPGCVAKHDDATGLAVNDQELDAIVECVNSSLDGYRTASGTSQIADSLVQRAQHEGLDVGGSRGSGAGIPQLAESCANSMSFGAVGEQKVGINTQGGIAVVTVSCATASNTLLGAHDATSAESLVARAANEIASDDDGQRASAQILLSLSRDESGEWSVRDWEQTLVDAIAQLSGFDDVCAAAKELSEASVPEYEWSTADDDDEPAAVTPVGATTEQSSQTETQTEPSDADTSRDGGSESVTTNDARSTGGKRYDD